MSLNWRWLVWMSSIFALFILGFFWSHQDGGKERIVYYTLIWVAMLGTVFSFPRVSRRKAYVLIGVAAVLVRLSFWSATTSDDVNRYLWEGQLLWEGENAYAMTADDERWEHLRDSYWEKMNHKDRLTAYPPGMELVMAVASRVWYHPQVFKLVALLGDLWSLGVLMLLSRLFMKPPRWLCFYAFNPVILASFAVEAHFDSLMVAGFLTCLYCFCRKWFGWAWFWLGVAIQMKLMALILLPFFILWGRRRKWWVMGVSLLLPTLVFIPYLRGLFEGLFGFASKGAFNAGFYEAVLLIGVPENLARWLGVFFFAVVYALIVLQRPLQRKLRKEGGGIRECFESVWKGEPCGSNLELMLAAGALFMALVIFSPIVHFWYLSWFVWLLVLRPSVSLIVLSGLMGGYFMAWVNAENGLDWGYSRTYAVALWVPFFIVFIWENRFLWKRLRNGGGEREVKSMSVVVPVYREGAKVLSFLERLIERSPELKEVIVVDGGAEEGDEGLELTRQEGERVPVRWVASPPGRGEQIGAGIELASGDLVAIMHADTCPQEGWVERVVGSARIEENSPAFALGQRYDESASRLLWLEGLNEARATLGGAIFGDQTLIVRREVLKREGGFPRQPLMEDVEVSLRLLEQGPLSYVGAESLVSARRWQSNYVKRFSLIISLLVRYRWARLKGREKAKKEAVRAYQAYYQ